MSDIKLINQKSLEEANKIFKLMGNPIRLQILHLLSQGELNVGKIASLLDLEQSAVSHQLSLLKEERLVSAKREGKSMYYQLDDKHVAHVINDTIEHVEHMFK
ncbi:metalloregulator ArsR/SmtB family transcription factor [Streptococcaceae bacterium ESL0687]|nr:metalloregulator ArsR/SmtB family transcription factor [Streptococcaceae bacterium ESL0687]